jgi:hypothetical protein
MDDFYRTIEKDSHFLATKGKESIIPPFPALKGKISSVGFKKVGSVPEEFRPVFGLIDFYSKKFKGARDEREKVRFIALTAAARYMWAKKRAQCFAGIKVPDGSRLEVFDDWSITLVKVSFSCM